MSEKIYKSFREFLESGEVDWFDCEDDTPSSHVEQVLDQTWNAWSAEIKELQDKVEKLIKCVEFYADYDSYGRGEFGYYISDDDLSLPEDHGCGVNTPCRCERIGGKFARKTLKEIENK